MDLLCRRCGYAWTPQKPNPKNCPRCHSWYWQTPRNPSRAASGGNDPESGSTPGGGGKPKPGNGGYRSAAALAALPHHGSRIPPQETLRLM